MAGEFDGKVAIVTGGGSGIGAAVAVELAAGGAKVLVADLEMKGAGALVERITGTGGTARAHRVDVADPEAVRAMVQTAREAFGGLHLAVNNAGIGGPSVLTADYPLDGWEKVIGVNLNGVFFGLKYEIPAIIASGGGAIVNMASILGAVGFPNSSAYVAAKHAVLGLTKNAALEYATRSVRINAVGPAFIDTPLLSNLDAETYGGLVGLHPVGRLGTSEEVSALTCFLLSERASFITGSYHLVDGGYTAH